MELTDADYGTNRCSRQTFFADIAQIVIFWQRSQFPLVRNVLHDDIMRYVSVPYGGAISLNFEADWLLIFCKWITIHNGELDNEFLP